MPNVDWSRTDPPVLGVTNSLNKELDCAKESISAMAVLQQLPTEEQVLRSAGTGPRFCPPTRPS